MAREIFEVTKDRFHLQDPCCYILQGTWPKEAKMRAKLDGSEVKAEIQRLEVVSALERFKDPDLMRGERITAAVQLPGSLEGYQKLSIYAEMPEKTFCWFSISVKNLEKRRGKPQFYIEEEKVQQGFLRVRGWAVAAEPVRIQIFDENKEKIQAEVLRTERVDVEQLYEEMEQMENKDKSGFFVELTNLKGKVVYIVFYAGNTKSVHVVPLQQTVVIRKKQIQEQQQGTVNGRVTDNRGQALPGVTVLVKGTAMGTVTGIDGNYKISLPETGLTLRFSFLGMGTREIVVTGPECNVILEEEQNSLEEAVVVGYGVVKKKDLTGSVSSVDTRLIEESAAADIGTIIQGQVSGLHILTGSGAPGEEVQIQIRGCASLSGNTSPLIVVDEVPMPSDFSINQLNPSDIKSIDVLKGGSSSAIYGSRASAGVILITMKKGSRNEKPLISYDYTFGTRQLVSDINVLNTEEFKLLLLEATRNSAQEQGYTNLSDYRYYKDYTTPGYFGEVNTPWMKLLMQPARVHKHNISVRGGGHSSNYSVSYGLIDEEGMLVNTSNRRHNLNLNLDTDLNKWLKMGVTFRGDLSKRGQTENFNVAAEARPDLPCYNEDGSYYVHKYMYQGEERFESNPMIEAKERDNVNRDLGANITSYLVSRPFGGLSLRLQYSYNYKQSKGRDFYPSMTLYGSGGYKGQKGQLTNTERLSENQELMGQIMYGKRIKKHNFDITMVGTLTDSKNSYASMTFADFPDDKTQTSIWQGVTYKDQMGYDKGALLLSYVARANYSFNDRYLLTVSWRADGSSRFSPDNRWSYFPSLAVAYNLTEEKFLRHNKVINFLKLRASVGKVGMGYVDEYGWRTLYDATEYLDQPAIVPGSMGNNNLKWEGTVSYELGLDYGFFKNNRISGTLEFYKKKTKDLLYRYTLSPGIGLPSANVNFAAIENRGIDFDINAKIIKGYAPLYQLSAIIALSFLLDSMEAHLFRGYVCQRLKQPASMITPIFLLGNTNN